MSIFFDFDVGPSGRRFRRAVDQDKKDIELFCNNPDTNALFDNHDIGSLIELSTLAIVLINKDKEVTGFIALCDHPNIPSVDPASWEVWMRNMYQKFYLSSNTLFIHFLSCLDSVAEFFLDDALDSIFRNDSYLMHIILVVPGSFTVENTKKYQMFKKKLIYKFRAKSDTDVLAEGQRLYVALRQDYSPKLKIRRASEEDNDDIVEILDSQCARLKEMYGNFYISELLGRHPESTRSIIVAEDQDTVVGVMCLNTELNYNMLQSTYDLVPYHGLVKISAVDKERAKRGNNLLKSFGEPIMLGNWSPFDHMAKFHTLHHEDDLHIAPNEKMSRHPKLSKVNFGRRKSLRRSFEQLYRGHLYSLDYSDKLYTAGSPTPSQATTYSVGYLLDEDPFDYDIVNIDSTLLNVPEVSMIRIDHMNKIEENKQLATSKKVQTSERRSTFKSYKADEPLVIYTGEPNAFIIELFGFREDMDERRAFDLLEAACVLMKQCEYCVIRVPCDGKSFALLQHFCFVPTKSNVCCRYALYVAHRNAILSKFRVRRAELSDVPQIALLLQNMDGRETLWTVENSIVDRKEHQAYLLIAGTSIVGIGVLEPPEQIDYIRSMYNIDQFEIHKYHVSGHGGNTGFATLKTALCYPVFEVHFRFFIREMLRMSSSSAMIWLTAYRNKWVAHKANTLASSMVPLTPRKFGMEHGLMREFDKMGILSKSLMAFSTWFISGKQTCMPKLNVDTRIVIVGASRTAMAFLNSLLLSDSCSYLTFTSITLISPNGLPYIRNTNSLAEKMFPVYRTNSDKYLKSIPYTYYVNVVHDTMVAINRTDKYITLNSGSKHYYDRLFLLFGKQYQHPDYMLPLLEREQQIKFGNMPPYIRYDVPRYIETEPQVVDYDTPENVFIINNTAEARKALNYIRNQLMVDDLTIIVYGSTIHTYCCLNVLLEMGVPAECIAFVEPFPPADPTAPRVPWFCNVYVDQTLNEVLDNMQITVYRSYYYESWSVNCFGHVSHVDFSSYFDVISLKCSALFYYGTRGIDPHAFVAIHKCGMAYDGAILIDHQFRTNDPSIYAAGPATRYNRRYFADSQRHKYYDSFEIGQVLGTQIRDELDPLFHTKVRPSNKNYSKRVSFQSRPGYSGDNNTESKDRKLSQKSCVKTPEWRLPELKKPQVWNMTLPGGLQYLEVRSPGVKVPHHYVQSLGFNGIVMETFKGGYFKLHLSTDLVVDGITCLTPKKYSMENFKNIYGMSSVVLNNVYLRYASKRIDDFYEFFRAPWAMFLYHEQLDELLAMTKEIIPKNQTKSMTINEALKVVGDILPCEISKENMKPVIRSKFEKSPHIEAIAGYVIEWLSDNDILLPMYLQPGMNVEFLHDLPRNPAFRRRKTVICKMLQNLY